MKTILTSLAACLALTACGTPDFDHPAPGSIIVDRTFPVLWRKRHRPEAGHIGRYRDSAGRRAQRRKRAHQCA